MTYTQSYKPNIAIHPGKTLSENLEYLKISQIELAERTGLTTKHISNIIKEKASITPDTALKLENTLSINAGFWNNLEKNYQANIARIEAQKEIEIEAKKYLKNSQVLEIYKELKRFGFVTAFKAVKENYSKIIFELRKYYGFDSLNYVSEFNLKGAFRKYNRKNINKYSIAAWLRLGQLKAQKTQVEKFDREKLKNSLEELKLLSVKKPEEYLPGIEKILAGAGVVLVCAPYFKNSNTEGATQWVSKDKVFIILKTTGANAKTNQDEGKFWFNLFHEIGHILKHSKKETFIDVDDNGEKSELEKEADNFAQKELVPDFDVLLEKFSDYKIAIIEIAKKYRISQSIVAGRIANKYKNNKNAWRLTKKFIGSVNYTNI